MNAQTLISRFLSAGIGTNTEIALQVAGHHRAFPSAALDKKIVILKVVSFSISSFYYRGIVGEKANIH